MDTTLEIHILEAFDLAVPPDFYEWLFFRILLGTTYGETPKRHANNKHWNQKVSLSVEKLNDLLEFHLFGVRYGAEEGDNPDTIGRGVLNVSAILALLKWKNVDRTLALKKGTSSVGQIKIKIFSKDTNKNSYAPPSPILEDDMYSNRRPPKKVDSTSSASLTAPSSHSASPTTSSTPSVTPSFSPSVSPVMGSPETTPSPTTPKSVTPTSTPSATPSLPSSVKRTKSIGNKVITSKSPKVRKNSTPENSKNHLLTSKSSHKHLSAFEELKKPHSFSPKMGPKSTSTGFINVTIHDEDEPKNPSNRSLSGNIVPSNSRKFSPSGNTSGANSRTSSGTPPGTPQFSPKKFMQIGRKRPKSLIPSHRVQSSPMQINAKSSDNQEINNDWISSVAQDRNTEPHWSEVNIKLSPEKTHVSFGVTDKKETSKDKPRAGNRSKSGGLSTYSNKNTSVFERNFTPGETQSDQYFILCLDPATPRHLLPPSFYINTEFLFKLRNHLLDEHSHKKFLQNSGYEHLLRLLHSAYSDAPSLSTTLSFTSSTESSHFNTHFLDDTSQATIISILREKLQDPEVFSNLFLKSDEHLICLVTCATLTKVPVIKAGIYSLLAKIPSWVEENGTEYMFISHFLYALSYFSYKYKNNERSKFHDLVMTFQYESSTFIQSVVLRLINYVIMHEKSLDERLSLRTHLLATGLERALARVDNSNSGALNEEIKLFNESKIQDDMEYNKKMKKFLQISNANSVDILLSDSEEFFSDRLIDNDMDVLYLKRLSECILQRVISVKFVKLFYGLILQLFMRFELDSTIGLPKWVLTEKLVRQLAANKLKITLDDYKFHSLKKFLKSIQSSVKRDDSPSAPPSPHRSLQDTSELTQQIAEVKRNNLKLEEEHRKDKDQLREKMEKLAEEKKNLQEMLRKHKENSARQILDLKKELRIAERKANSTLESEIVNLKADKEKLLSENQQLKHELEYELERNYSEITKKGSNLPVIVEKDDSPLSERLDYPIHARSDDTIAPKIDFNEEHNESTERLKSRFNFNVELSDNSPDISENLKLLHRVQLQIHRESEELRRQSREIELEVLKLEGDLQAHAKEVHKFEKEKEEFTMEKTLISENFLKETEELINQRNKIKEELETIQLKKVEVLNEKNQLNREKAIFSKELEALKLEKENFKREKQLLEEEVKKTSTERRNLENLKQQLTENLNQEKTKLREEIEKEKSKETEILIKEKIKKEIEKEREKLTEEIRRQISDEIKLQNFRASRLSEENRDTTIPTPPTQEAKVNSSKSFLEAEAFFRRSSLTPGTTTVQRVQRKFLRSETEVHPTSGNASTEHDSSSPDKAFVMKRRSNRADHSPITGSPRTILDLLPLETTIRQPSNESTPEEIRKNNKDDDSPVTTIFVKSNLNKAYSEDKTTSRISFRKSQVTETIGKYNSARFPKGEKVEPPKNDDNMNDKNELKANSAPKIELLTHSGEELGERKDVLTELKEPIVALDDDKKKSDRLRQIKESLQEKTSVLRREGSRTELGSENISENDEKPRRESKFSNNAIISEEERRVADRKKRIEEYKRMRAVKKALETSTGKPS